MKLQPIARLKHAPQNLAKDERLPSVKRPGIRRAKPDPGASQPATKIEVERDFSEAFWTGTALPTNTVIDTSDDLGRTIATYRFDVELADSLLTSAGMTLAGCLTAVAAVGLFVGDGTNVFISTVTLVAAALIAAWGVLVASSRLRRKDDRFVVRRLGLTHHHGATVTHTKWTDIASVEHSGTSSGSQLARWNGNEYRCQINLRNGNTNVFDNYVVKATSLGHEIEQHSLAIRNDGESPAARRSSIPSRATPAERSADRVGLVKRPASPDRPGRSDRVGSESS